jgi:ureidoglycolate hydrolase
MSAHVRQAAVKGACGKVFQVNGGKGVYIRRLVFHHKITNLSSISFGIFMRI